MLRGPPGDGVCLVHGSRVGIGIRAGIIHIHYDAVYPQRNIGAVQVVISVLRKDKTASMEVDVQRAVFRAAGIAGNDDAYCRHALESEQVLLPLQLSLPLQPSLPLPLPHAPLQPSSELPEPR